VLFIPDSSLSPYFSPLKSGLVVLSAEISQHKVQSVQVHFHPSLSLYFSIRRHHSLQTMKRCILSTRIPFSEAFHFKLRCKNCRQQLSSKVSSKWKRQSHTPWDVTSQRCLFEQLFFHNLLHTGSFICYWYDIQSISESQQFPFIRFCFFHLLSSPGPFTIGLTVSDRTNLQCVVHHFRRKNKTDNWTIQGPKRWGRGVFGALEPWNFCCGAQSLRSLSTWSPNKSAIFGLTEPWSEAMEPYSHEFSIVEPWSPAFLRPEPWSPKTLWEPHN